ncbi:prenyltransferase [Streptomyces sp. NPDC005876]|uniref:prenyltransferase n=1 Tax=Streptomyces sp. NPDC005876 TaxID=3157076 RepID=UPI0033E4C79F
MTTASREAGHLTSDAGARRPGVLRAMVRLGRVKFLLQSTSVVGAGSAVAVAGSGRFSLRWYLLVLLFAWLGHLMTHYCNEYFDLEADRANAAPTSWTGGSRVLVEGLLAPQVSLATAFVLLFGALGVGVALPTLGQRLVAVAVLAVSWFYTAPPLRLNYHALGETACATVLYALVPLLAFLAQAAPVTSTLLTYLGIVFTLQILRCLIMNLPDIPGDRCVGKTTLAGLLGPARILRAYAGGHVVVYTAVTVALARDVLPPVTGGALLATLPVPVWVVLRLRHRAITDQRTAELVTFWASMVLPLSSCAVIIGMTLSAALYRPVPAPWWAVAAATLVVFTTWLAQTVTATLRRRSRTGHEGAAA